MPRLGLGLMLVLVLVLVLVGMVPTVTAAPSVTACGGLSGSAANGPMSTQRLAARGGLIYLFDHRRLIRKPFACATYYLERGINIDATDPRADRPPLTPLTWAIKYNDLKLARYLITHGASLTKPAGRKNLKPMAYAYHLAFRYPDISREAIITLLTEAATAREDVASR